MLHIKDIEAFAHINEALARDHAPARGDGDSAGHHHPALHPALLVAMAATGRLKPDEASDASPQAGAMLARLMGARRG